MNCGYFIIIYTSEADDSRCIVEPPNKGQVGTLTDVHYSEVVINWGFFAKYPLFYVTYWAEYYYYYTLSQCEYMIYDLYSLCHPHSQIDIRQTPSLDFDEKYAHAVFDDHSRSMRNKEGWVGLSLLL